MNKKTKLNKLDVAIFLILFFGIIVRFILAFIATPSGDACWHSNIARFIAVNHEIPLFESLGRDVFARPPLFHFIGAFFYSLFSVMGSNIAEIGLKLVSPIFGSLSLWVSYLVAKRLFNKRIAFLSLFFLAIIPLHLLYSTIAYTDMVLSFFVVLSIYFALENKFVLSVISAGFAMLSKVSAPVLLFIIIFILFNKYKSSIKVFLKKTTIFILISIFIAAPWYIRNWISLQNPVWPQLRFIFGGVKAEIFGAISKNPAFTNLFSHKIFTVPYFEFFGVPGGDYNSLFFFNFPFLKLAAFFWILITLITLIPFVLGFFKAKKQDSFRFQLLVLWILVFFAVLFAFALFSGIYARLFLPALPALAMIWALGIDALMTRRKIRYAVLLFLIVISLTFLSTVSLKTVLAAKAWNTYEIDFNWIKDNTKKEDKIFTIGQCFSYYFDREVYLADYDPLKYNLIGHGLLKQENIPYVWSNQQFYLDPQSILPEEVYQRFENSFLLVYANDDTGTKIYKVI